MRQRDLVANSTAAAARLAPLCERFNANQARIYASGPSLPALLPEWPPITPSIAVNDAWQLVPAADALYATDEKWWSRNAGVPAYLGVRVGWSKCDVDADIICLQDSGVSGYDHRLGWVRHGGCSGVGAIHLAAQLGASEIVLIGFDMRRVDGAVHFLPDEPIAGQQPHRPDFELWIRNAMILAKSLKAKGVKLTNATPGSALRLSHA